MLRLSSTLLEFEFNVWRVWAVRSCFIIGLAISAAANNPPLVSSIIKEWLFEEGELLRSLDIFKRAMASARSDLEWVHAAVSVENVRSNLVDGWHWRMLNDARRNHAFHRALRAAVDSMVQTHYPRREDIRVLDIGCGSGIFSVLAAR